MSELCSGKSNTCTAVVQYLVAHDGGLGNIAKDIGEDGDGSRVLHLAQHVADLMLQQLRGVI